MRTLLRPGCHRHLETLLAFADHRDVSAVDEVALRHLDACPDCRQEVEAAALTAVALRRLAAEAARAEPSAEVWPRLRARLDRRPAAWRWRAPLAGLLVSAGLVAVVLAPTAWLRPPDPYIQEVGLQVSIFDARRAAEDRSEASVLQQQLALRARPIPHDVPAAGPADVAATWAGPDGLGHSRDVESSDSSKPRLE